jgi:hypothetical protein
MRGYFLGIEYQKKLKETIVIIIKQDALNMIFFFSLYQRIEILLNQLGLPESKIIHDHP